MKRLINILCFTLFENKTKYIIILFCIILSFFSCTSTIEKDKVDSVIKKLTERYPQFNKGDSDYYRLTRSISYDNNNFEIQLRTEPDSINDRQSILIFINSKREYYAVPFFSNSYVNYWQFPNDQLLKGQKKLSSTFNKELRNALLFLKNDKKTDLFNVAEELRYSLLNCKDLTLKDSLLMNTYIGNIGRHSIDNEEEKEVKIRLKKNYDDVIKNSQSYILYQKNGVLAYLDQKKFRIYQFIYHHDGTFSIKCYRQDRKLNMIDI